MSSIIKDALEYVVGLRKRDAYTVIGDNTYVLNPDGTVSCTLEEMLYREREKHTKDALFTFPHIETTTLSSIADYIKEDPEGFFADRDTQPMIHIVSPREVTLYARLDCFGRRMPIITAKAITPNIQFDKPYDIESFIILLQSCFAATDEHDDRARLLSLVSHLTDKAEATTVDNGMAQEITVRKGVATLGKETTPNPVALAPFRTFVEVPQPESLYVFRIHDGPRAALYQAGGAEWEIMALRAIREHFVTVLEDMDIHIIA